MPLFNNFNRREEETAYETLKHEDHEWSGKAFEELTFSLSFEEQIRSYSLGVGGLDRGQLCRAFKMERMECAKVLGQKGAWYIERHLGREWHRIQLKR